MDRANGYYISFYARFFKRSVLTITSNRYYSNPRYVVSNVRKSCSIVLTSMHRASEINCETQSSRKGIVLRCKAQYIESNDCNCSLRRANSWRTSCIAGIPERVTRFVRHTMARRQVKPHAFTFDS